MPAGNVALKTSIGEMSLATVPSTVETKCIMWLNLCTAINSVTATLSGSQTLSKSFRARSTSIRCSDFSLASVRRDLSRSASLSASTPRGREPAIGCVTAFPPTTETKASGEEPTTE